MYRLTILLLCLGFCFGQVLEVDSIYEAGQWTNPENVYTSDDLYGQPGGNNDPVIFQIDVPTDTNGTIDSVKVFVEQYVSDTTRAAWRIRPIINGNPGTTSADIMGTENDQELSFDISTDITGWSALFDLTIDLRGIKVGGGQNPDWFADYLYVFIYSDVGIFETEFKDDNLRLTIPSIVTRSLSFSYYLDTPSKITIDIYNSMGSQVIKEELGGFSGTNHIMLGKVSDLSEGVYYIHVKTADAGIGKGKFIVIE